MAPIDLNSLAERWAPCMVRACWQGALAAAAVWIVCRLCPRLSPAARAALWWLVCARMLLALTGVEPLSVAVLPAEAPAAATVAPYAAQAPTVSVEAAPTALPPLPVVDEPAAAPRLTPIAIAFALWLVGVLALASLAGRERRAVRRLTAQARRGGDPEMLREVASALGLPKAPPVLVSERAGGSLVVGALRPTVILSRADLSRLTSQELRALLAHELAHIRRRDLWAGALPFAVRLLFFFHPLVWLACREYDLAREAACDAEALRVSGLPPADYGRLLLKLGLPSPAPALASLGAASPHGEQLRRRLLGLGSGRTLPRWSTALVLAAVAAALCLHPIRAAAPLPAPPRAAVAPAPKASPAPAAPLVVVRTKTTKGNQPMPKPILSGAAASLTLAGASVALAPAPALPQGAPPVPVAPPPPVAIVAAAPRPVIAPVPVPVAFQSSRYQYTLRLGDSVSSHANDRAVATAQRTLAKAQAGDCIVVDRDGKRYLITDPATLREIKNNFATLEALGHEMEAKGKLMEAAGKPMEELGKQMEAFGKPMEAKGKEMAALGEKLAAASEADRPKIQEQMRAIQEQMKEIGNQMREVGKRMREQHGEQMKEVGKQMKEIGNQMRAAAKEAVSKTDTTIDNAFKNNLAVELK